VGRPGIPNHKSKSGMVYHGAYHITQRLGWTFFTVIWWDLSNKDFGLNQPTEGFLCFFGDWSIYIYIRVNPNGKLVAWQFWDINYIISLAKVVCFRRVCKICYDVKTPTIQLYLWDISYPNQKNIKNLWIVSRCLDSFQSNCYPVPGFKWVCLNIGAHSILKMVSLIPCHPYKKMP
jgi:hypothetical protein